MAKKKKSKFKKILKKLGKVAALGGAAYGASKLFGGSKPSGFLASGAAGGANLPRGDRSARAKRLMTSDDAYTDQYQYDPIRTGGVGVKPARIDAYDTVRIPKHHQQMQWGSGLKKGGRVTGIAKRGFGRALMKGKK